MAYQCSEHLDILTKKVIDRHCTETEEEGIERLKSKINCMNLGTQVSGYNSVSKTELAVSNDQNPTLYQCSTYRGCQGINDLPLALISEIIRSLDAKDLGIISCVSTLFQKLASEHCRWKELYLQRWSMPSGCDYLDGGSWKSLFVEKEMRSIAFLGRYSIDVLHGHTEAVRSVFILSSKSLIFTGGYDSIIRVWDMEQGLLLASSRPIGCTIRALVADTGLLVVGGTDGFLECWRAVKEVPYLFDVMKPRNLKLGFRLWDHEGPVTCLSLDTNRIYSGSWDMTVRIWDRTNPRCLKILRHGDWVWSLAPHESTVVSTAGTRVYIWNIKSEDPIVIENADMGNVYSIARSRDGTLLFTGGDDGSIKMFDINNHSEGVVKHVATWIPHSGAVHSLAFDYPWLVSSSSDGKLALIDARKLLRTKHHNPKESDFLSRGQDMYNVEAPQRMIHGFGPNLFSVDIGSERIVSGGQEGVVRIWNFSQAIDLERRAKASRGIRFEARMRRKKLQLEMNLRNRNGEQCSVAAKNTQMNSGSNGIWCGRRTSAGTSIGDIP